MDTCGVLWCTAVVLCLVVLCTISIPQIYSPRQAFNLFICFSNVLSMVYNHSSCTCYRLLTCELTGGTVSIVESVDPSLQQYLGRQGTVLSESKHCLHIAYKVEEADRGKS